MGQYSKISSGGMIGKLDLLGLPLSYHVGILGIVIIGILLIVSVFHLSSPIKNLRPGRILLT